MTKTPERIAVCPGTYDPVTVGHVDIIEQAAALFDRVIVAVGVNPSKKPMFPLEQRLEMLREAVSHLPNVEVDSFDGLTVEYARSKGARFLVRGLRMLSDFEYEFQQVIFNRILAPEITTVFFTARTEYLYLSSTMVRHLAQFDAVPPNVVPPAVREALARMADDGDG